MLGSRPFVIVFYFPWFNFKRFFSSKVTWSTLKQSELVPKIQSFWWVFPTQVDFSTHFFICEFCAINSTNFTFKSIRGIKFGLGHCSTMFTGQFILVLYWFLVKIWSFLKFWKLLVFGWIFPPFQISAKKAILERFLRKFNYRSHFFVRFHGRRFLTFRKNLEKYPKIINSFLFENRLIIQHLKHIGF